MWCQINGSDRVQFILLHWGIRAIGFLKVLKERPHSGCNSFQGCSHGLMASESFSLALQQRAAREVVSEEMPRRALATRILLFCEITSALLIIELGLFVHILAMAVALIIVPFLRLVRLYDYAALCLGARWSSDGCSFHHHDLPFASIFTNPGYSSFGLRRRQKGNCLNALTIIVARVACASVLVPMVLNSCQAKGYECSLELQYTLWEYNKAIDHWTRYGEWEDAGVLCRSLAAAQDSDLAAALKSGKAIEVQLCSEIKLPVWMKDTCQAGHVDAVEYFHCRKRSWYAEYCNSKFRVCAMFFVAPSLDTFILQVCCIAPLLGLALMVLIHLAGFIAAKQTNQPSLMNMPEKQELRQRIRMKACHFEQQLQKEQLEHSIWCLGQNCIMDRWWVSVNRIDSILKQWKWWWPFRIIPNLSYRCL